MKNGLLQVRGLKKLFPVREGAWRRKHPPLNRRPQRLLHPPETAWKKP